MKLMKATLAESSPWNVTSSSMRLNSQDDLGREYCERTVRVAMIVKYFSFKYFLKVTLVKTILRK